MCHQDFKGPCGSGHCGGQDERGEVEMIQVVKRRCSDTPVRRCKRSAIIGIRRGRGGRKSIRRGD
ncbi:hypothetical protein H5410_053355 [Solanum commersonii]|uniref:Uncharacterized protein n=1 Tax=Solanum commersonii TaxID=4109 RepID=A0A9J5X6V3_SOLCO|nr:hypothetical protein H5410_053355 [Solanum commersonii]